MRSIYEEIKSKKDNEVFSFQDIRCNFALINPKTENQTEVRWSYGDIISEFGSLNRLFGTLKSYELPLVKINVYKRAMPKVKLFCWYVWLDKTNEQQVEELELLIAQDKIIESVNEFIK